MLGKNEIKDIQSLSQKKHRDELKLFIAEGPKIVGELVELIPHQVKKIYAVGEWIETYRSLVQTIDVIEVSDVELSRLSQQQTPNQVIAVIRKNSAKKPDASSFTLYIDTIQDPGNFGTIVRIADWFGIKDMVCSAGCVDLYNPKVVQSTMASIARVNVFYNEKDEWLKDQTVPVFAATLDGSSLYEHSKTENGILIVGNESKGIRPEILQFANEKLTIPKKGNAESLNAAVATGIILSHLLK